MPFAHARLAASRHSLEQGLLLLERLDDSQYATGRGDWSPVGAQYRHVIEHYQCLLAGAAIGRVDYDSRRRDPSIERSRTQAIAVTREIHRALASLESLTHDHPLAIQIRSSEDKDEPEWSHSTLGRELQFLVSHTVHHFALIKLLLAPDGVILPAGFGTAPSTLAHARSEA